jgi:hypothetical protein
LIACKSCHHHANLVNSAVRSLIFDCARSARDGLPSNNSLDATALFASENENHAQLSQQLHVDKCKTLLGKPSGDISWCDKGTIIAKKYGSVKIAQLSYGDERLKDRDV